MNKYSSFFNEWKLFFIKLGLVGKYGVSGYTHDEIVLQMSFLDMEINTEGEYYNFLKVFGKEVKSKQVGFLGRYNKFDLLNGKFLEREFLGGQNEKLKKWEEEINCLIENNSEFSKYRNFDLIIFSVGEEEDFAIFTFPLMDEFIFGYYDLEQESISIDFNVKHIFRNLLFQFLITLKSDDRRYMQVIPWYSYFKKNSKNNYSKWKLFLLETEDVERKAGIIFEIDELVNKFLIHLIEEHNAPYLPEIYDPYNDLRTFHEYLQ